MIRIYELQIIHVSRKITETQETAKQNMLSIYEELTFKTRLVIVIPF